MFYPVASRNKAFNPQRAPASVGVNAGNGVSIFERGPGGPACVCSIAVSLRGCEAVTWAFRFTVFQFATAARGCAQNGFRAPMLLSRGCGGLLPWLLLCVLRLRQWCAPLPLTFAGAMVRWRSLFINEASAPRRKAGGPLPRFRYFQSKNSQD